MLTVVASILVLFYNRGWLGVRSRRR